MGIACIVEQYKLRRLKMNSQQKENIAKKLRMLRAEYNLTQSDVANKLGITQQTYSKYENQTINMDTETIIKICDLYGVSSDYLLGIESGKKNSTVKNSSKKKSTDADTVAYETTEENIKELVKKVLAEMNNK